MNWWLIVLGAVLLIYPAFEAARCLLISVVWLIFKAGALVLDTDWGFVVVAGVLAAFGVPTLLWGLGILP